MNVQHPRDDRDSTSTLSSRVLTATLALALLAAAPATSLARGYVSINIGGPVYPAYPAYPVYAYPAYPVYPRYYRHRHRHYIAASYTTVDVAPPPLPVYEQPPIPGNGYIWTPGYWAYGPGGYYWVPGTWVLPPYAGALWTPGYWGWNDGYYAFTPGYWGLTIGFYGGIDYGFGYGGIGYDGGYWNHSVFFYNRAVNNIRVTNITNVYNRTIINNTTINRTAAVNGTRTSFNGGTGGVIAKPTAAELAAARQKHTQPTAAQQRQVQLASRYKAMFASVNHGAPAIAATQKPGAFSGDGIVKSHAVSPQDRATVAKAEQARPAGARAMSAASTSHGGSTPVAHGNAPHDATHAPGGYGMVREHRPESWRGQPQFSHGPGADHVSRSMPPQPRQAQRVEAARTGNNDRKQH